MPGVCGDLRCVTASRQGEVQREEGQPFPPSARAAAAPGSGQKKNSGEMGHCAAVRLLRSRPGGRSTSQGRAGFFSEHAFYPSA